MALTSSIDGLSAYGACRDASRLFSKLQLVIPRAVRDRYGFRPGQKLQLICLPDRIELIPLQPPGRLRGFLAGPNTFQREADRP